MVGGKVPYGNITYITLNSPTLEFPVLRVSSNYKYHGTTTFPWSFNLMLFISTRKVDTFKILSFLWDSLFLLIYFHSQEVPQIHVTIVLNTSDSWRAY